MWFFQDLIRCKVYDRIDYEFLIPGHTYGPTDRYFAVIEKHTSKVENVYVPSEWFDHVHDAVVNTMSRVEVLEMQQENFHDHRTHFRKMYTERSTVKEGKSIDF